MLMLSKEFLTKSPDAILAYRMTAGSNKLRFSAKTGETYFIRFDFASRGLVENKVAEKCYPFSILSTTSSTTTQSRLVPKQNRLCPRKAATKSSLFRG